MAKNQEKTKNDIYNYLKSNGYEPIYKSTSGKEVSVPEEAEVIEFQYKLDGENYGTSSISLDNEGRLKVFYSDKIENSPNTSEHGGITWNELIPNLRRMTFGKVKSFELDDMDNLEYDMAKREHSKKLEEGYYPMGKKASYSDNIPECKIIIKHNRNIEEGEQRYRNIHQIFIENQLGERFLAPTTKPGLARVYARHIAEGGKVNDDKWNHINSLCEEYSKMAGFIRATRNGQFNEDTQRLVTAGLDHYLSLRESLHKLAGKRGYNNYFESWQPPLMESEGEEDLSEMFINSSLDPRIESVIPILNRLNKNINENQEIKEVSELEEWADSQLNLGEDDGFNVVSNYQNQHGNEKGQAYTSTSIAKNPTTGQQKSMASWDYTDPKTGKNYSGSTYTDPEGNAETDTNYVDEESKGLWANIHAKRNRIKHGSGEKMRKPGSKGAPTSKAFRDSAKTSKNEDVEIDEGLADEFVKMAQAKGLNARIRGTPEQEKQRTNDMLAQRKKEQEAQGKKSAEQDFANINELEQEYDMMLKKYKSLGGSNWQYADREQNLSDREREARSMEPILQRLATRISLAKKVGNPDTLKHMQSLSGESGEEGLEEDIGPQQKAVGQLGATSKVNAGGTILGGPLRSQKGLRGKLVGGATESVDPMLARIKKLSGL